MLFFLEVVQKLMGTETSIDPNMLTTLISWSSGRYIASPLALSPHSGPASSMMAMVCLLHDFALAKVMGASFARDCFQHLLIGQTNLHETLVFKTLIDTLTYLV
jgi:hypothetical protein